MKQKTELMEYLVSDEYLILLERAILSRITLSAKNKDKHMKAINLIRSFTAETTKNDRGMEF